jgi:hypothetical protein
MAETDRLLSRDLDAGGGTSRGLPVPLEYQFTAQELVEALQHGRVNTGVLDHPQIRKIERANDCQGVRVIWRVWTPSGQYVDLVLRPKTVLTVKGGTTCAEDETFWAAAIYTAVTIEAPLPECCSLELAKMVEAKLVSLRDQLASWLKSCLMPAPGQPNKGAEPNES